MVLKDRIIKLVLSMPWRKWRLYGYRGRLKIIQLLESVKILDDSINIFSLWIGDNILRLNINLR
jgi:hypothetical protein